MEHRPRSSGKPPEAKGPPLAKSLSRGTSNVLCGFGFSSKTSTLYPLRTYGYRREASDEVQEKSRAAPTSGQRSFDVCSHPDWLDQSGAKAFLAGEALSERYLYLCS